MIASRAAMAGLKSVILIGAAIALSGQSQNWLTKVERTEASHVVGNPETETQLTEWVSYTCPACANFSRNGEEVVKLAYVGPGKAKLEIRHVQRNIVDVTVTLAAWCGGADKFLQNHSALMWRQEAWLEKARKATAGQQQRWMSGPATARRKAIASDVDLYAIMQSRGIDRNQLDRCLADDVLANRLTDASAADYTERGIASTPSFALDGEVIEGAHGWPQLAPLLSEATKPDLSGSLPR